MSKPFVDGANARETDRVCDCFEDAWRSNTNPRIEDFVVDHSGPRRSAMLRQLVLLEWSLRQEDGEQPNFDEYVQRFPGDELHLRDLFEHSETVDSDSIIERPGAVIGNYKLLRATSEVKITSARKPIGYSCGGRPRRRALELALKQR